MATPAITDLGACAVAAAGRIVKRKVVTIAGGDINTYSDPIVTLVAGECVGVVGTNSSLPGADATLTWATQSSGGTNTVIGTDKVTSGTAFQNDLGNSIVNNLVSKSGETLVVKSDVAITLYLSMIQGDRIIPAATP